MQIPKAQIRKEHLEIRDKLLPKERDELSLAICEKLYHTKEYLACNSLFTYVSFQAEVSTMELIANSLANGKKVYVPRVEKKEMEFYQIESLDGLIRSKFGILEPVPDPETRYQSSITGTGEKEKKLMILPGLAFDKKGNRIGYGGGYYDKYLSTYRKDEFYKVALAYDFQIIEDIPTKEYDQKVDEVITPSKIIECSNKTGLH